MADKIVPGWASDTQDPTAILEKYTERGHLRQTRDEEKLVASLNLKFLEAKQHRTYYDREIDINRRLLRGRQLLVRTKNGDVTTFQIASHQLTEDIRQRFLGDNRLRPIARALVGKHCRIIPTFEAIAASPDDADVRAAETTTAYIRYYTRKEKMRAKYVKAHRYLPWAGTGIFELQWDPNGGEKKAWCETCNYTGGESEVGNPCPDCAMKAAMAEPPTPTDPMDQQMAEMLGGGQQQAPQQPAPAPPLVLAMSGDVTSPVLDVRYFYPEPGVEDIHDMDYCFTRKPLSLHKIRKMFPDRGRFVKPDADMKWELDFDNVNASRLKEDTAWIQTYHERPTEEFPEGRIIHVANSIVLNPGEDGKGEPHPLHFLDRLPFYVVRWERNQGYFWGEGFITQAGGTQQERNHFIRDLRDQRVLTVRPPLLVPINSKLSKDDMADVYPGKAIAYNPMNSGGPNAIKYLEAPPFPPYTYNELDRMDQAMKVQAGVTDQEMGESVDDQSGRYAAIQEAQSSETVKPIIVENLEEYRQLHEDAVAVAHRYLPDSYVWNVRGQDRVWSAADWAQAKPCDVELIDEDSLSQNPALRLEQCERLLKDGFFTDPETGIVNMEKFARLAGIKDSAMGADYEGKDRAYAATLPDKIIESSDAGQPWNDYKPWDDAKVCAESLASWLKGVGRSHSPQHQQAVGEVWMVYADIWAKNMQAGGGQAGPKFMPSQPPQQQQQQPAGTGAGQLPSGGKAPGQEAKDITQQADQMGETLSRPAGGHEA